mmetsp:Transcript_2934/g.10382  ORF Transcript_2934/g.10382 Transcript_2934/m.10382 type:complete len:159 (-) Transcript_2934:73-549(-)
MESEVTPFDSQEAKPYKNDADIQSMTNLVAAYQRNEIGEFEKILNQNRRAIMEDAFIRDYIEDLLKNIRTQVVLKLIRPYKRVTIPSISKELNVEAGEVEALLVSLILDGRVQGHIDQVNGLLELDAQAEGTQKYEGLAKWSKQLTSLHTAVVNKLSA